VIFEVFLQGLKIGRHLLPRRPAYAQCDEQLTDPATFKVNVDGQA
jgi:hypothetical protein